MKRLAVLLALSAAPVEAVTPDEALAQLREIYSTQGVAAADAYLLDTVEDARAAGTFGPSWAIIMVAGGNLVIQQGCSYERGLSRLAIGQSLATEAGNVALAEAATAWRAVHLAELGLTERAAKTAAPLTRPWEATLGPDWAAALEERLADPPPTRQSPAFDRCEAQIAEAYQLMLSGQIEAARSRLLGIYFPEELLDVPVLRLTNALRTLLLYRAAIALDAPEDANQSLATMAALLADPGSSPLALRGDLLLDPKDEDMTKDIVGALATLDDGQPLVEVAQRWKDESFGGVVNDRSALIDETVRAILREDYRQALNLIDQIIATPSLSDDQRREWEAIKVGPRAYLDLQEGRGIDREEIQAALIVQLDEARSFIGAMIGAQTLVGVLREAGETDAAVEAAATAWRHFRQQGTRSTEAMAGQAEALRPMLDNAIADAFTSAGDAQCIEIGFGEVCTQRLTR